MLRTPNFFFKKIDYTLILRSSGGCGEVEELSGGEQLVVPEAPVIITHHFLLYTTLGNIFLCHLGMRAWIRAITQFQC